MTRKKHFCMGLLMLLFMLTLCGCGADKENAASSEATQTQTMQSGKKVISVATNDPAASQEDKTKEEKKMDRQVGS